MATRGRKRGRPVTVGATRKVARKSSRVRRLRDASETDDSEEEPNLLAGWDSESASFLYNESQSDDELDELEYESDNSD